MARRCKGNTRVHTIMPRLPLAIRGGRAAWIGKTLRLSGMNAPRYGSAGECVDQIVSGRSFRRCKRERERQAGQSQQFPAQNEARLVGPTFDFFRLC